MCGGGGGGGTILTPIMPGAKSFSTVSGNVHSSASKSMIVCISGLSESFLVEKVLYQKLPYLVSI